MTVLDAGVIITGPEVVHVTDRDLRTMTRADIRALQNLRPAPGVSVSVVERRAQGDLIIRIWPEVPCITSIDGGGAR